MSESTPDSPQNDASLIEAPRSKAPIIAAVIAVLAVVVGVLVFAMNRGDETDGAGRVSVKLGVVGASDPYWETYKKAAADEGIDVKIVDFSDYAQPNPAVTEGELDMNQFQHIIFLADYNVAAGEDLVALGSTAIYPLGLHSDKYESVEEIPAGETVIVPDDETNQARGLLLLQAQGLIELKGGGTVFSTLADIDQAASKVKVKAVAADLTPASLPDVAAAVINNDFVVKAGLSFDDAIATDDPADASARPYVNVFAVRAEDKDNETYNKMVEIYQNTQSVLDGVQEQSGGTAEFVKMTKAELAESLATVEADTKAQND